MGDFPLSDSQIPKPTNARDNSGEHVDAEHSTDSPNKSQASIASMRADTQDGTKIPSISKLNASANLIAGGLLTNVTLIGEQENLQDKSRTPEIAPAAEKTRIAETPEKREQTRRAKVIQEKLLTALPSYANIGEGQPTSIADLQRRIHNTEARKQAIQKERDQGVWGSASQQAYGQYQKWYHEVLLRNVGDIFNSLGLELPANQSLQLKTDTYGLPENPQLFRTSLAGGTRTPDSLPDAAHALENRQFRSFLDGQDLIRKVAPMILETSVRIENKFLRDLIQQNHYPPGWLKGLEEDPIRWHDAAAQMVQLASDTRNMLETMDHLNRAGENKGMPFVPPPGTNFARDSAGEISRNKDGTIQAYALDLPAGVFEENPANAVIVSALRDWHKEYGSQIEQGKSAYIAAFNDPDRVLWYGDEEVSGKLARIVPVKQADGTLKDTFIGLVKEDEADKTPSQPGERREPCNLLCSRPWIETNDKGEQIITQKVDAYQIPLYGAYNLIGTKVAGFEKTQALADNKIYAIKNDGEPQLVKGSQLNEALSWQRAMLRSGQTASILMDAAMLASGIGEGLAVYRAAKAGTTGITLASSAVRKELRHAGIKSFVAVAGLLDNAGANEYAAARALQTGRSLYFVGDMGASVPKLAKSIFVKPIPTPLELAKAQELKNSPWLTATLTPANWAFRGLEPYFAYKAQSDLRELSPKLGAVLSGERPRDLLHDALLISQNTSSTQASRGKPTFRAESLSYPKTSGEKDNAPSLDNLEKENTLLDHYAKSIAAKCSNEDKAKVESIMARTKELLVSQPDSRELSTYKTELLANFILPDNGLDKVVDEYMYTKAKSRLCPNNDLMAALIDPAKRVQWNGSAIKKAEEHDEKIGPNIRAASVIALLSLSKQADGSLPETLVTKDYSYLIPEGEGGQKSYSIPLTTKNAVQILLRDFSVANAGGREVAAGDLLTRIGAISGQQYAHTLLDVMANPQATVTEKMETAPRLLTIMSGLKVTEQANQQKNIQTKDVLTSQKIENSLRQIVQTDNNNDVRAMSAALLYGANHPDAAYGSALLKANDTLWQTFSSQASGNYAKQVTQFLQEQAQKQNQTIADLNNPADVNGQAQAKAQTALGAKFNASLILWDLSKNENELAKKQAASLLAECITNKATEISMRAIDTLVPDGIKLLEQEKADSVRKTALSMLSVPQVKTGSLALSHTQEQQAMQAMALMKSLESLYRDASPELKAKLCQKLEGLIDPRQRYDNDKMKQFYALQKVPAIAQNNTLAQANLFPAMQAAAINTLASFNAQESISLIRARLTGNISFGEQMVAKVNIANPEVRLAAINALAQLKDPQLNELLPQLILANKENNAAVAERLYDLQVEFPSARLPLERDRERAVHDKLAGDYTPVFSTENGKIFERDAYSLLEYDKFSQQVKDSVEDSKYSRFWLNYWTDFSDTQTTNMRSAASSVDNNRWSQWQSFCNLSKMQENKKDNNYERCGNRDEAIEGLDTVLKKSGRPLAKPLGKSAENLTGYSFHANEDSIFWSKKAASAIVDGLKNGFAKDKFAYSVLTGLEDQNVGAEAKLILADGAKHLTETKFSRLQLANALERVFTNLPKAHGTSTVANNMLKTRLLKDFAPYMHKNSTTIGLLKAISENDPSPSVKELAKQSLNMIETTRQKATDRNSQAK